MFIKRRMMNCKILILLTECLLGWFHLSNIWKRQLIGIEKRSVIEVWDWQHRGMREFGGDGKRFSLDCGGEYMWWWIHEGIQLSKVIKLYTSKEGSLPYVNYTTMNLIFEMLTKEKETQWDIFKYQPDWQNCKSLLIPNVVKDEEQQELLRKQTVRWMMV